MTTQIRITEDTRIGNDMFHDNENPHIAFISSGDPHLDTFEEIDSGGTGPIWELARTYDDRGNDVTIYSGTYHQPRQWQREGVRIVEVPTPEIRKIDQVIDKFPIINKAIRREKLSTMPGEMVERLFGRLLFSRRAAEILSIDNPDIVYLRDRISAFFPVRSSITSVFTLSSPDACDFYYETATARHPANQVLFKYKQWIEECVLDESDEIITMNESMGDYLVENGFDNPTTVTLGVPSDEFVDIESRQEQLEVLYVGRFDGNKRPEWLLEAFLETRSDDFELHFVGSGPREKILRKQMDDSPREADIHIHGHIPQNQVLKRMRRAAVLVLPSEFESCSNVIVEAMASGCPVIASDTMGASQLITDRKTGVLFDKDDKESLITVLDELLQDRDHRRELAEIAHEHAIENHTMDVIADKYLEIGQRAIEHHE